MFVRYGIHDAEVEEHCACDNLAAHRALDGAIHLLALIRLAPVLQHVIRPPD